MKPDKKYISWGVTTFLVLAAAISFYYVLFHGINIMTGLQSFIKIVMPIIDGFVLAYLMTPILNFLEAKIIYPIFERILKAKRDAFSLRITKRIRVLGIFCTVFLVVLVLYAFFSILIPQLVYSLQSVILMFPKYIYNLENWIMQVMEDHADLEKGITSFMNEYFPMLESWVNNSVMPTLENMDSMTLSDMIGQIASIVVKINEFAKFISTGVIGGVIGGVINVARAFWNLLVGLIISIYLLYDKEKFAGQGKKMLYSIFSLDRANITISNIRFIHNTFIGFILGKIIDSIIIGIICFIGTSLIGTPYPVLVSVIVGVTNVIPFFGPYIGAIPSAILVLMVDPLQCVYFLIFVLLLQQFDGNILGPAILGESTGLSSFWVIFAITFFGGLWGVFGMIIGVPLFAIVYAGIKETMNRRLIERDLPIATDLYQNLSKIRDDHTFVLNEKTNRRKDHLNLSEDELLGKGYSWLLLRKNKKHNDKTKSETSEKE